MDFAERRFGDDSGLLSVIYVTNTPISELTPVLDLDSRIAEAGLAKRKQLQNFFGDGEVFH